MRVLGVVQWTNRDKAGTPIARILPLFEIQKAVWRPIEAIEEFPTQGQAIWFAAHTAVVDTLITFKAEPNPGHKDEHRVVDVKPVMEVLDFRRYGNPMEVRTALAMGLPLPGPFGNGRALVWCKPDVLVGPVELTRLPDNRVKLSGTTLARVPSYSSAGLWPITVNSHERLVRVEDSAHSGFVDWDDDFTVIRRAIEGAVRLARQTGHDAGQTKKQIEEAAKDLGALGVGPDAQLERYRLERALTLCEHTDFIVSRGPQLVEALRDHPAIQTALDKLSVEARDRVERDAREAIARELGQERTALDEVRSAHARVQSELAAADHRLAEAAETAKDAEAAINARVASAVERPLELLAEVSVLRPLLAIGGSRPAGATAHQINWSGLRGESVTDKVSLRRGLTSAARARGVDPALMMQLHAATVVGLMPVTLGPGALAALSAYAHGTCGGRLLVLSVSPSVIQPRDLDDIPGGGLVAAAAAAKDIDGISLVVLEGVNRSPLEASVVPMLQLKDAGLSAVPASSGLRLAATLVRGATTVPVTPQMWSHAVAIYPKVNSPSPQVSVNVGDVPLSSELLALGDVPTGTVDALIDTWPDCDELRPALERFGSALTRLYDEESRVSEALLHSLVLPYVVTALSAEEQAEALSNAGDADGSLSLAVRRLRRRLC